MLLDYARAIYQSNRIKGFAITLSGIAKSIGIMVDDLSNAWRGGTSKNVLEECNTHKSGFEKAHKNALKIADAIASAASDIRAEEKAREEKRKQAASQK